MARPLLTFDLDGVLCRPPFGINPGSGRHKRRDAQGKGGILWLTEGWRYLGRKPMPGALEAFSRLSEMFECVVVTARGEQARPLTERWFQRYLGRVPRIEMRPSPAETSAQFKARVVGGLGPLAHFEDDPFTATWLAELLPRVYLVDWGRNRWLAGPNITRVRSVSEAVEELVRLAQEGRPAS
ncbi:hypothetical protein [Tepidiforma sp.]|uniref:hypothetical protein n=1 Tax=Tepidiforma sp. TaxID=2682230 RepID=UPI0026242CCF|nr:hypothetical protein [Tepidiforma sp.]MCX7616874.1 hypothetical protein [Tepidiforma sp.]